MTNHKYLFHAHLHPPLKKNKQTPPPLKTPKRQPNNTFKVCFTGKLRRYGWSTWSDPSPKPTNISWNFYVSFNKIWIELSHWKKLQKNKETKKQNI